MAIYLKENLKDLLRGKFILLLGDSVQRSVYKDLVVLCHDNRFMAQSELRKKGEDSFLDDELLFRSELTNGIQYREVREFKKCGFQLRFHFLTRVYNDYVESILQDLDNKNQPKPDVVVLNSCLWDISRYGVNSMEMYRDNLEKLCNRLEMILPPKTLVIWRTTLPVSEEMKGGFLTADAEWCRNMLKLDVLRANYFAYNIISRYNYDVLDMHYHFRFQLHRRARDGVHWNMYAHRRMTNILLSHIAQAWNLDLPELPWADSSKIDFASDEIEMNTTDVLKQAYDPRKNLPLIRGLLPTPPKPKVRSAVFVADRFGARDTPHMYSSFYQVPEEEEKTDCSGNYHFLHQQPIYTHQRNKALPTAPYLGNSGMISRSGKIRPLMERNHGKWTSRNQAYQRGKASEMMRIRIERERQERRIVNREIIRCRPPPRLYMDSVDSQWSRFSRHRPSYVSSCDYGDPIVLN